MSVNFDFQGSQNWLPPICGICTGGDKPRIVLVQEGKGIRHWPHEGHRTETPRTESLRTETKRGRPKKWASESDRLKAYRERKPITQ